jgi:type II secretory pathway component PulC
MKINRKNIFAIIPKLNILLTLSGLILISFLALKTLKPYKMVSLNAKDFKIKPFAISNNESIISEADTAFDEEVFKKQLFSQSAKKKTGKVKQEFLLLGVSVGRKKLAMIRDTKENKNYYCAEGDIIVGFKVKQIFKDKVILESGSRTIEISQ